MKTGKNFKTLIWVNIISLLVFILILLGVLYNFGLSKIDFIVNSFMPSIENNFLTSLSIAVSFIFDINVVIIISLILSAYLWIKFSKKDSVLFIFTMGLNGGVLYILKEAIQRARPLNALVSEGNFAFPSAHASTAVVFFGLLIYLIYKKNKLKNLKLVSLIVSIFMVLLICFARLYLNVHWFSDVLGGVVIGIFILTGCIILRKKFYGSGEN
ncbi:MAG: phosphatase PAP2 family protein [Candidatus Nanoarchaeia archaeon]|nr:phosphatase PAP2 family protein [Candidatus Nanoarchaeia archaeon]MDD5741116.1 phosphatase PAP2 family protein [Candidatus Nanoarchaeia archaeon]